MKLREMRRDEWVWGGGGTPLKLILRSEVAKCDTKTWYMIVSKESGVLREYVEVATVPIQGLVEAITEAQEIMAEDEANES